MTAPAAEPTSRSARPSPVMSPTAIEASPPGAVMAPTGLMPAATGESGEPRKRVIEPSDSPISLRVDGRNMRRESYLPAREIKKARRWRSCASPNKMKVSECECCGGGARAYRSDSRVAGETRDHRRNDHAGAAIENLELASPGLVVDATPRNAAPTERRSQALARKRSRSYTSSRHRPKCRSPRTTLLTSSPASTLH